MANQSFKQDKSPQPDAGNQLFFARMYKVLYEKINWVSSQYSKDENLIKDCIQDIFMELMVKQHDLNKIFARLMVNNNQAGVIKFVKN